MNREDIRDKFRAENPEITTRVITDAVLNEWILSGDKEICAITRCIVSNESETFNSAVGTQYYNLETNISKFFDIDDIPGGGVYFDDDPLDKTTIAEMNQKSKTWKKRSNGTPKKWWRRGKYLWFDKPPDSISEIAVDCIYISDDFDGDTKTPYNELTHLEPYHDGILKYLQWRTKQKLSKQDEASIAKKDYFDYTSWMKRLVAGYSHAAIYLRPVN